MAGEMTASQERKESLCGWKEMDLQKKTGLGPNRIPGPELGNTGLERKNHGKIQRSFRQIFKTRFEKVNLTQCRQRPRRQWEGVKRLRGREETERAWRDCSRWSAGAPQERYTNWVILWWSSGYGLLCFYCYGPGFDPWSGNYDPASCAASQKQDKNLGLGPGSGNAKWRISMQYSREKTDRTWWWVTILSARILASSFSTHLKKRFYWSAPASFSTSYFQISHSSAAKLVPKGHSGSNSDPISSPFPRDSYHNTDFLPID